MTYNDLTDMEKQHLDDWLLIMRPLAGEIQRTVNKAVAVNDNWTDVISSILAQLGPEDEVPNKTGLPASSVKKTDIEAVAQNLESLLFVLDQPEVRQRAIRLAGLPNVTGG